ncbi:MAG: RagB/SusD family nutrient uptake outer membrane protein [Paludibacter sp.]|nr:RagB/SusD family nutrient uptake outer membrane protein [Paludibacter sp.]
MKPFKIFLYSLPIIIFSACADYLDVVPDKTQEVDLLFQRKDAAYNALATCYHFLPQQDGVYSTYVFASDELTTPLAKETPGVEMMRGKQNADDPILGYWNDTISTGYTQYSLWKAIRVCNTFIGNIDKVNDMTDDEKQTWKSEVIFLKAYYHFLLFCQYGPIPIVDDNLAVDATTEEVRVKRAPVDEVVDYIVSTIDKAIEHLPVRVTRTNDLGRIDQVIAYAIKSRVLLYAASPLFNGNSEYYENFKDKDGQKLFNTVYDKEKWKKALDASEVAIKIATENGVEMYTYKSVVPAFDSIDYKQDEVRVLYDYRYMFTEKWNTELIWGNSNPIDNGDWWMLQAGALPKSPSSSSNEAAWQWVSPSMQAVEMYYTKNGLPIDEDLTYKYSTRYSLSKVPDADKYHATQSSSVMVPNLHLSREPRFYASIGFDRGIYRTWGEKWNLQMKKGETHGRQANSNDYAVTGYLLKKICHPNSTGENYNKLVVYEWPIIRLAELYLNYAEAYNEYYGPGQKVYDALNVVRSRAGIPNVETVWSDAALVRDVNKHLEQSGLREIIQQEREIELAFEGQRNNDIRRWKKANQYFNQPIRGWSVDGTSTNAFYKVIDVSQRSFITPRDYLMPIKTYEIVKNSNLVQNPGW